jgi:hypothetical protein
MDLDWTRLGYVALCVLLPAAWGGFAAWLFGRLDRRHAARKLERPPIDYTI